MNIKPVLLTLVFLLVLLSICLLFSQQILQPQGMYVNELRNTDGTLTFTVRTVSYGGSYAPRNAGAIWVTNSSNQFVKTIKIWAQSYRSKLVKWVASSGNNTTGAITSASLNSHQLHTVTWNGTNTSNVAVPDGDYKINVEFAEHNATTNNPGKYKYVTFTKSAVAVDITPANETYFTNMHLTWAPVAPANGTISGTITNTSNQPISGAIVTIGALTATSNASGGYSFSVQPGTYSASCTDANYLTQSVGNIVVTSNQTTTANFVMEAVAGGTISGLVTDLQDQPIAGATVTVGSLTATTLVDGGYSISVLPGTYSVSCSAANYISQTINDIVVTSNQITTANFVLNAVLNGTISGHVTDSQSLPIAGAIVTAGALSSTSDETGFYSIQAALGTYNMTCSANNHLTQNQNDVVVTSGQTTTINFSLVPVANQDEIVINDSMTLIQNYPNPFKYNTTIKYYLEKNSYVTLNVYNTKGQLTRTLSSGTMQKGWYLSNWNGKGNGNKKLPSGNYYIRLEANGKYLTRRAIVIN